MLSCCCLLTTSSSGKGLGRVPGPLFFALFICTGTNVENLFYSSTRRRSCGFKRQKGIQSSVNRLISATYFLTKASLHGESNMKRKVALASLVLLLLLVGLFSCPTYQLPFPAGLAPESALPGAHHSYTRGRSVRAYRAGQRRMVAVYNVVFGICLYEYGPTG